MLEMLFDCTCIEIKCIKPHHHAGSILEAHGLVCAEVASQDCSVLRHSGRGGSLQDCGGTLTWTNQCDASAHLRHLSNTCVAPDVPLVSFWTQLIKAWMAVIAQSCSAKFEELS